LALKLYLQVRIIHFLLTRFISIVGLIVLDTLSSVTGSFVLDLEHLDWSSAKFKATGAYMPDNFLEVLRPMDAIFFGAVGDPSVPDHISLWSLLLPIRQRFQQYANVRPIRILRGLKSPLAGCGPVSLQRLSSFL
jgi:tartrate dehydrogenase/decarboxylase/D-malate dehydrogenase